MVGFENVTPPMPVCPTARPMCYKQIEATPTSPKEVELKMAVIV